MTMEMRAQVQWIRSEFGGRKKAPLAGLRPTIRFQRGVPDWLSGGRDVEVTDLHLEGDSWCGSLEFRLANAKFESEEKTAKYLVEGELFELLDGYRVIGVGKIVEVRGNS